LVVSWITGLTQFCIESVGYPDAVNDPTISDPELMRAIGQQDRQAFETLYDRYNRLVFSTAYRVLQDAHGAEDVAQEVFVRLWKNPDRYDEQRGRFLGWLLSVTRNRAIDEVRSRKRRPLSESQIGNPEDSGSLADETPSEPARSAMELAEMTDQREMVRQALADLPEEQRLAIELAYYKGLTQVEIAAELNTPLGTVKTRVRLGMQKLRLALEGRVGIQEGGSARPNGGAS
jgi:RNA polymerase sigma-70 factor (ECF subfamily)